MEAVVDPAFEELSEQQASRIYERAFRAWIQRKLGEGAPGLRRALVRLASRDSFDGAAPMEQLQYAAWKLIEWRDHPAPWRTGRIHARGRNRPAGGASPTDCRSRLALHEAQTTIW